MTKGDLIKALQKSTLPDDTEVVIQERACENAHGVDSVEDGWYLDDGMDAPSTIPLSEDPNDYGFEDADEQPEKVIVIE